jgi:cardiolipin synthase
MMNWNSLRWQRMTRMTLAVVAVTHGLSGSLTGCSTQPVIDEAAAKPILTNVPARVERPAELSDEGLVFNTGNSASVKIDGPGTFKAMFTDIDAAQQHIHLETYILEDDVVGNRLAEHLVAARQRGVEVRLLVDAYGSLTLPNEFKDRLEAQGIQFQKFHPVDPKEDPRIWRTNNRDHRKVLVVDGKIAHTGGINFSDTYREGSGSASVRRSKPDPDVAWRDTQVRITGPVVAQFQRYFLKMWNRDLPDDKKVNPKDYIPVLQPQGDIAVAVAASVGGDTDEFKIYSVFSTAIEEAKKQIWITQAYFAPDQDFIEMLKAASQRGVDVRLLLPGISDASLVIQASRASYQELLESGVRIYERKATVLHAKTMVVDGCWSTIGSSNFDYRSFVHNYELNAVLESCKFGETMEKLYLSDLQQSQEITLAAWEDRPWKERFGEWFGNAFRQWL